jgi:GNAT superfamily N-acetyltransferase
MTANNDLVPVQVIDRKTERDFLDVARRLYKGDPNWVCPLYQDIRNVFSPDSNNYYKHGEASRWVLKDKAGSLIGRIAAFVDYNSTKQSDTPAGGCGFFECINDQKAANTLFDTAREWLLQKGLRAMDGPINFGERDKYWGLLVSGFTQPAYEVPYNHAYYQQLFENYGFKVYFRQEGFHFDIRKEIPGRFWKIAEWVAQKPGYEFRHFTYGDIDKYILDFTRVFNEAWKDFKEDFEPLQPSYVRNFLMKARVILEEKFIWFAYHNGEPIAIYLMIPDVNLIFRKFNGKLNLCNKLRLVYDVKTKKLTRAKGILMGVVPRYQGRGIESAFIYELREVFKTLPHYKELEFSWVGDFNPPMRKLWTSVGAEPAKEYITYRFLFDRNAPFHRFPIPE